MLGRTLTQLERTLATEVVDYYLCAEAKALREMALREPDCAAVYRARVLYHESDEAPTEPFLDEWSAAEFGAREWLGRMQGEFG